MTLDSSSTRLFFGGKASGNIATIGILDIVTSLTNTNLITISTSKRIEGSIKLIEEKNLIYFYGQLRYSSPYFSFFLGSVFKDDHSSMNVLSYRFDMTVIGISSDIFMRDVYYNLSDTNNMYFLVDNKQGLSFFVKATLIQGENTLFYPLLTFSY